MSCVSDHDKCYSPQVLWSQPPARAWICRKCGEEGLDTLEPPDDPVEFTLLRKKFWNERQEGLTPPTPLRINEVYKEMFLVALIQPDEWGRATARFGMFSEPNPTLSTKGAVSVVLSSRAPTLEEAQESLIRQAESFWPWMNIEDKNR